MCACPLLALKGIYHSHLPHEAPTQRSFLMRAALITTASASVFKGNPPSVGGQRQTVSGILHLLKSCGKNEKICAVGPDNVGSCLCVRREKKKQKKKRKKKNNKKKTKNEKQKKTKKKKTKKKKKKKLERERERDREGQRETRDRAKRQRKRDRDRERERECGKHKSPCWAVPSHTWTFRLLA